MNVRMLVTALILTTFPIAGMSQSYDRVVQADVVTGWRTQNGNHMAALKISLNPGWKTYWRAPGDAGIPPRFTWRGTGNMHDLEIIWPTPEVFYQNGMRSIGYQDTLVLPIKFTPSKAGKRIRLKGKLEIGVCRDICVPQTLRVSATLPASNTKRDPEIAAAIAARPLTSKEGGVERVSCTVSPTADGLKVIASMTMPSAGGREVVVIETSDPEVWVAEASTSRKGKTLTAVAEMLHVNGGGFMLDRSALRLTVLGTHHAVDIQGCSS